MSLSIASDADFMKIAGPIASEFGFASIRDLIEEQLCLMLQAKITHYQAECRLLENRYGCSYEEAFAKNNISASEDFSTEDDLNDWRFVCEAIQIYQTKLRSIENA